jgi:rubrerythrin
MKHQSSGSARSLVICLVLVCSAVVVAGLTEGCKQDSQPKDEKKTLVTLENLQTAYGVAMKRAKMYELFIPRAEKEKFKGIAALYRALHRSEAIHARLHADMLRKHAMEPVVVQFDSTIIGTTMQTLKMATSCEELESGSMYPNLARTAGLENFQEGIDQFNMLKPVEERHVELLKEAQDKAGNIGAKYLVCPGCGYIITSDQTEECPVCKAPKAKFEKV